MAIQKTKTWRVIRWILFLPIAILTFFLILNFSHEWLSKFNEFTAILFGALATAASIYVSKVVAPAPRVALPVVAQAIFMICLGIFINKRGADARVVFGWPAGVALWFIISISTAKGPERSRILRTLRWILLLPVAASAGLATHYFLHEFIPLDQIYRDYLAIALGSAIFVGASGLLAPSYRPAIILLIAPISYLMQFGEGIGSGIKESQSLLGSGVAFLIAWAVGTVVGAFITLRTASGFKKPLRAEAATGEKNRRYKGTAPFQDFDLDRRTFFGRDHESRSLLSLVMAERLVVLFAKSGMGKSSLINAGLVEPLRKRRYFPIIVRLNDQVQGPMESLLAGIHNAAKEARVDVLSPDTNNAWRLFKTAEFWSENNDLLRPVIILDQFEEIFTLHSPAVRGEFINQLGELVRGRTAASRSNEGVTVAGQPLDDTPPPHLKIVIALREDFLANLEELAKEIPAILHNRSRLGPLSRETAREAITGPARLADDNFRTNQFTYQEEAVQRMIDFLAKRRLGAETKESNEVEPVQLQLICHYLEEMVRQRQAVAEKNTEIEISEADLGGEEQLQQVMEGFYDRTIAALTPHRKARAVQRLCEKRLVSSGGRRLTEDQDEIKRRFKLSDRILMQLVDARLLRAESRLGGTFYEVSHDRLVKPILKSRKKRLVKQRWTAAAAIPLLLIFLISSGYLFARHQDLEARQQRREMRAEKKREEMKKHAESNTYSHNSRTAILSLASLIKDHNYKPGDLLEQVRTLNPATLVILTIKDQEKKICDQNSHKNAEYCKNIESWEWENRYKSRVLQYIDNHHDVFIEPEKSAEVPTLLGALLFVLDDLKESFKAADADKNKNVSDIRSKVLKEYNEKDLGQCQGFLGNKKKADSSDDMQLYFVTNQEYKLFDKNHKFTSPRDDTKEVKVNWFEAFAFAACMGKELPRRDEVKTNENDIALQYPDMLNEQREQNDWRNDLLLNGLIERRSLRIYLQWSLQDEKF